MRSEKQHLEQEITHINVHSELIYCICNTQQRRGSCCFSHKQTNVTGQMNVSSTKRTYAPTASYIHSSSYSILSIT